MAAVTDDGHRIAQAWDVEYAAGRYRDDPPVPFIEDIVEAARDGALIGRQGVYLGCGNGRNYLPLVAAGLDLIGLDISRVAIDQLARRSPHRRDRLICGPVGALNSETTYPIVIGIQVFQHGNQAQAHQHIKEAQSLVSRGGLFCVRVNAVGTDLVHAHDITERDPSGSFTVRYLEGPKTGLDIHFFAESELTALFSRYRSLLGPRLDRNDHESPGHGNWSQWEAIWQKST